MSDLVASGRDIALNTKPLRLSSTLTVYNAEAHRSCSTNSLLINMLWDSIEIHLFRFVNLARSASFEQIVGILLVSLIIASALTGDDKRNIPNIPTYYASRLEPALLSHLKFVFDAKTIISNGCQKVRCLSPTFPFVMSSHRMLSIPKFKRLPFIVRRFDADYNILPIRYLEELHRMPPSVINGRAAVTQVSAGHSHGLVEMGFQVFMG